MSEPSSANDGVAALQAQRQVKRVQSPTMLSYYALSATTTKLSDDGERETAYRYHRMDMPTRRLIPHLLGVSHDGCDHPHCTMLTLNVLAGEYFTANSSPDEDHLRRVAVQLGLVDIP